MSARTLLMAAATAGPPGASLNLSFGGPTLDPRITFTRASTATYFDATGTMQTATANTPRFDYDPVTHALRGLLIEEARTNITLNSANLAGWSVLQTTWTPNVGPAPDGTNSTVKLAEDATNNFHTLIQTFTVTASVSLTLSVYAKAAENRYLIVAFDNNATNGATATFDLQTGTITASGLIGAGTYTGSAMQLVGNGIYRCSVSGTVGASTTCRTIISLTNTSALGTFPGYQGVAGNGVLIWGGQLEQGAFPTSYIATSGATVTRAEDLAALAVTGWYVPPGGSWLAEFILASAAASGNRAIVQNTPADARFPLFMDGTGHLGTFDGPVFFFTTNATSGGVVAKGASTWASTPLARVCLNGGTIATSSGATNGFPVIGPVSLFGTATSTSKTTGYIRRVRYWPRVLSDAEMQSVTR